MRVWNVQGASVEHKGCECGTYRARVWNIKAASVEHKGCDMQLVDHVVQSGSARICVKEGGRKGDVGD